LAAYESYTEGKKKRKKRDNLKEKKIDTRMDASAGEGCKECI
jgi:hypothetical protein